MALGAAKAGSKLQKAESATGLTTNTGGAGNHANGQLTMTAFTDFLSQQLHRPVADRTGFEGAFRVALEWISDSVASDAAMCGASLITGLQEQLGLSLTAQEGPVEILVVNRADRTPAEN